VDSIEVSMSMSSSPSAKPPARQGKKRGLSRRGFVGGLAAAGLAAAGVAAAKFGANQTPAGIATPTTTGQLAGVASSPGAPVVGATPPGSSPAPARRASAAATGNGGGAASPGGIPAGMALVTSLRLPLFGIGGDDWRRLLRGEVDDWQRVGSAVSSPVKPLALKGAELDGARPVATFPDYEALVAGLDQQRGGVALVPLDSVDFRVNVLSVDGTDPLRDRSEGAEPTLRIGVVGDIVPGRNVHAHMAQYGDFTRPFLKVAPHLSTYDLTFANLEGNLSDTLPQPADPHSFSFVSSPAMLDGFKLAGIDAVTLANNHSTWNEEGWGVQGLLDTLDALDAAGVPHFGAGRTLDDARAPWSTIIKGKSVALLGIDGVTANYEVPPGSVAGVVDFDAGAKAETPGTNPFVTRQFLDDITAAVAEADIVIPYFHMGEEYVAVPPEWAVAGARAAIDAGATMVVTLHPHVIQGMEVYNGKPIVYSPGNFIFDQMFSVEVRSGYILGLTLRGNRVVGLRCHGVEIEDFHQPRLMTAGEQADLMDRFWASTDRLIARGT
jgi:poly-gamma-glutamate capsule biosynthesis protein CapA/YwtB (metallophosphatase superfamily)